MVAAQVAHQHPPRAEHVRRARDHHVAHPQLAGERDRVHPAAAAERHEREVARVVAAVDRDELQRVDHVVVGDPHDPARRVRGRAAEPLGHPAEGAVHRVHVRVRAAAEERRVDPPEREVRVGRRRVLPALAVGGGPRRGARGLRADVQLAEVVDPGDAAAAVADLDEVDDRHHDRVARGAAVALDPVVGHHLHVAALDQRALRRRAADVEREHVRLADQPPQLRRAPEPARRPALHHRDRDPLDVLERVDAAVGLHDVRGPAEPLARDARVQRAQVALGDRLDVRRQHRGAAALVLAPLARDLVRRDGAHVRPELPEPLEHGDLVCRVRVGVQQADGDRLHLRGAEVVDDRRQAGEVQRRPLGPGRREPARHLAPQRTRHERLRLDVEQVEEVGPVPARDLERVAEPLRGDEPRRHALALGQRVDDDGRPVHEEVDLGGRDRRPRDHLEHPALEVGRRRVALGRADLLAAGRRVGVEVDEVGERPAHVGGHADAHRRRISWSTATASRIRTPCTSCW